MPTLVFIYAILRGKLVPRSVVDDVRKDRDERLAEKDRMLSLWEATALKKDQALAELIPAIREQTETGRMNLAVLEALKQAVGRQPVGGQDGL
jgi:hypothetical protein